ncbi:hypothetical protein SAMN05444358_10714 [Ruegeria halocynthiae]|uniref:Tat pathway signal sequence domain protein n=1 Tax=Ruegeria halocynthiae TaxID=985054 RepID=A0A1H3CJ46_9RHOB|nr:hypothetical protein [Ruegeria halocynthiae]SDX53509.1 hypothetical protein SAMN05444358_10714 [Ruegeria halocynthiae]
MLILRLLAACSACLYSFGALAQTTETPLAKLSLELNAVQDVGEACRLTFLVNNQSGSAIDEAVFETVIFNADGGVVTLSLFDFRDLPMDRPRVRQFDLPGMACAAVGRALINGASSCVINGSQSDICQSALSLSSRIDVELLG